MTEKTKQPALPDNNVASGMASTWWGYAVQGICLLQGSDNGQTWLVDTGAVQSGRGRKIGGNQVVLQARLGDWQQRLEIWRQVAEQNPLVPRLYANGVGQASVYDGTSTWFAMEFRRGRSRRSVLDGEACRAGHVLSGLHKQLRLYEITIARDPAYAPLTPAEVRRVKYWMKRNRDNSWIPTVRLALAELKGMTELCASLDDAGAKMPQQLVDMDFHPGNVLFASDSPGRYSQITAILDLDVATLPVAASVAFAAYMWQWPQRFLAGYGDVDPGSFTWQEWAGGEVAHRVFWILRTNCILGVNRWKSSLEVQLGRWQRLKVA